MAHVTLTVRHEVTVSQNSVGCKSGPQLVARVAVAGDVAACMSQARHVASSQGSTGMLVQASHPM